MQGHGRVKLGLRAGVQPGAQGIVQSGQQKAVVVILRRHHVGQQCPSSLRPHCRRGKLIELRTPVRQARQQARERSGQLGLQPTHFRVGFDAIKLALAGGIAQQHAAQAKPAGVLLSASVQPQIGTVCLIQAPANPGSGHPLRQPWQGICVNAKARCHRRHIQQIAQLTEAAALLRQAQQPLQGRDQRAAGPCAEVGNVKRNEAGIVSAVLPKHRSNGRGHLINVRHHDHHIAWLYLSFSIRPGSRVSKQLQKLIVQHLHLAHHAVRHVKNDRSVLRWHLSMKVFTQGRQIADAMLNLAQQQSVGRIVLIKQVDPRQGKASLRLLGIIELVQLTHKVAALPPPSGQQGVRVCVHLV